MTVKFSKPAINLREELASLRSQKGEQEQQVHMGNLITNGDFSNGSTGWVEAHGDTDNGNPSASFANNEVTLTGYTFPSHASVSQVIETVRGRTYSLSANVTDNHAFFVIFNNINQSTITTHAVPSSGLNTITFVAASDQTKIVLRSQSTTGISSVFDNVIVHEVGKNLITNGSFDYNVEGWNTDGNNYSFSHVDGGLHLVGNAFVTQEIKVEKGKTYTVNVDVSGYSGTATWELRIGTNANIENLFNGVAVNTDGQLTGTFTATTHKAFVTLKNHGTGGGTHVVRWDNVTCRQGTHPVIHSIPYNFEVKDVYIDGELAREGAGYDYEIHTDGLNKWIKTAVEPTLSTEVAVIGVQR